MSFSAQPLSCSRVLENAILAFGNGSDVKTGASQPGVPSPATDNHSPHLATTTPGAIVETEQNTLRAQIPAQVRQTGGIHTMCTIQRESSTKLRKADGENPSWDSLLTVSTKL